MKFTLIYTVLLLFFLQANAQESLKYQQPSKEIMDLADVQLAPRVLVDSKKEFMVFLSRDVYKSIEELSQKELRLAGLRIDPKPILEVGHITTTTFRSNL